MNKSTAAAAGSGAGDVPMNSQIQFLRSRVEADLKKPAVVLVTSALAGDGKSFTAHSLAKCFTKAGHRTALIDPAAGGNDPLRLAMVEMPREDTDGLGRERLVSFVDAMRAEYDYTVIDAGTFSTSDAAMSLTRMVDGILVAVRVGRAPTDEDELMIRMIEHSGGRIIGVVATEDEAVAEFERTRSSEQRTVPERPRREAETKPVRTYAFSAEPLTR